MVEKINKIIGCVLAIIILLILILVIIMSVNVWESNMGKSSKYITTFLLGLAFFVSTGGLTQIVLKCRSSKSKNISNNSEILI